MKHYLDCSRCPYVDTPYSEGGLIRRHTFKEEFKDIDDYSYCAFMIEEAFGKANWVVCKREVRKLKLEKLNWTTFDNVWTNKNN